MQSTSPNPVLSGIPLYSAAQVRELDRRIIDAGTPGIVLMKRAAEAVFNQLARRWPGARKLLVVCGKGNNGGDGYLVARLAVEKGYAVDVLEVGVSVSAPGNDADSDALRARRALLDAGVTPRAWESTAERGGERPGGMADVIVDALLGTGLQGAPRPEAAAAIAYINAMAAPTVAVDSPSGLCSNTGRVLGEEAVHAALTVTFIGRKKGMHTGVAADYVGEQVFDALGADARFYDDRPCDARLLDSGGVAQQLPHRSRSAYKQSSGHLLVIAGDEGMAGAAALTAIAALRTGAGLVSVATRNSNAQALTACEPALMVSGVEQPQALLPLLEKATAVAIGPGLGQSDWAQSLFGQLLSWLAETRSVPIVADADALNLLASQPRLAEQWQRWASKNDDAPVMTPHTGEAARLANVPVTDRYATAQALATAWHTTVVLKGAGTLVANGDQTAVVPFGNPVLATAGSGDVLSGVIAAMLAQGLASVNAASVAACLHGLAADDYAACIGPYGLVASDLPELIVAVMNRLQLA